MSDEALNHMQTHLMHWISQVNDKRYVLDLMTEEKAQEIYTLAYFLYQKKEYQDASYFFRLLVVARPSKSKYWKSLGACLQMLRNYEEGLNCYIYAQTLKKKEPDPYLYVYAADCYFALKRIKEGLKSLDAAHLYAEKTHDTPVLKHVAFMREQWTIHK